MIYLGNGMYSDASDTLSHYGVLGMKWGVHKARIHEKNIYRHNRANGMSKEQAKTLYKSRMNSVKKFAKKNKGTKLKINDIYKNSYNSAKSTIGNYDAKRRAQRNRNITTGLLGAAALGYTAYGAHKLFGKRARNTFNIARGKYKVPGSPQTQKFFANKAAEAYLGNAAKAVDASTIATIAGIGAGANALASRRRSNIEMKWKKKGKTVTHSDDLKDEPHLEHHGIKGQKWGVRHDRTYKNRNRKRNKRKNNKKQKTKSLPKNSFSMLMRYKKLSPEEFEKAQYQIAKKQRVVDSALGDLYRIEKGLNYPNVILNDVVKTGRNIEWVKGKVTGKRNPLSGFKTIDGLYDPEIQDEVEKYIKGRYYNHSDTMRTGNYLEHYGVKGMKWGVRKDRNGINRNLTREQRKTSKDAEKDAIEFARAKMFYGEGAGNRRKLIKNSVNSKKKKDKFYANEFDEYLKDQDMAAHVTKAKSERKRKDTAKATKRVAKKTGRIAQTLLYYLH